MLVRTGCTREARGGARGRGAARVVVARKVVWQSGRGRGGCWMLRWPLGRGAARVPQTFFPNHVFHRVSLLPVAQIFGCSADKTQIHGLTLLFSQLPFIIPVFQHCVIMSS